MAKIAISAVGRRRLNRALLATATPFETGWRGGKPILFICPTPLDFGDLLYPSDSRDHLLHLFMQLVFLRPQVRKDRLIIHLYHARLLKK